MRSCSAWQLYVIVDRSAVGVRDLVEVAAAAIRGGADVIQLRDKTASAKQLTEVASRLLVLTRAARIPLIINDRVEVARAIGADGVHVGQEDMPIAEARAILGEGALIGKSTHSVDQAVAAEVEGANYIGLGPIFSTPTKPDYQPVGTEWIAQVLSHVRIPTVCIGGIDSQTLVPVLQAGARCVVVVRAVCGADDPETATRDLKDQLAHFLHPTATRHL